MGQKHALEMAGLGLFLMVIGGIMLQQGPLVLDARTAIGAAVFAGGAYALLKGMF